MCKEEFKYILIGLNPCFNGRYSLSIDYHFLVLVAIGRLNPCFNGRYSLRREIWSNIKYKQVLILVLMEDTL